MEEMIIVPLVKSPYAHGRIGPVKLQDWFRGLQKALSIQKLFPRAEILVVSNTKILGETFEADLYFETLLSLGGINVRRIYKGYETIDHINQSFKLAVQEKKSLVFISSFLHWPRVQWLILRHPSISSVKVKHYAVFGIPHPHEAFTDIILTFLFPLIDLLGGREKFREILHRRRASGKF